MTFKRVNKGVARIMYNRGFEVKLLPCKVNSAIALDPTTQGHFWVNPSTIKQDSPTPVQFEDSPLSCVLTVPLTIWSTPISTTTATPNWGIIRITL